MCRAVLILPCFNGSWREEVGGVAFGQLEEMWLRFDLAKLQRPDLGNRAEKRVVNMVSDWAEHSQIILAMAANSLTHQ